MDFFYKIIFFHRLLLLGSCYLLLLSSEANALPLRCGNKLVDRGDKKFEVLQKCSEPSMKEVREDEKISIREDMVTGYKLKNKLQIIRDEWSYNFGPNRFLLFIEFENGRVVSFHQRGYGF